MNHPSVKNYPYLISGALDSRLSGLVSADEKQQLTQVLTTDSDVLADINEIEIAMEEYLADRGVPPPPGLKTAISERINRLEIAKQPSAHQSWAGQPTSNAEPATKSGYVDVAVSDTHIRVHKNWRTAFIVIFVLSKIFLIAGLYFYFKSNSQAEEIRRLQSITEPALVSPGNRTP